VQTFEVRASPAIGPFLDTTWQLGRTAQLGAIVGVALDPSSRGFVVLDGSASRLVFFDSLGRELRSVGRQGEGPGEFVELPRKWSLNAVAMTDDFLLVNDVVFLNVFDRSGNFLYRAPSPQTTRQHMVSMGDNDVAVFTDYSLHFAESDPQRRTSYLVSSHEVTPHGMRVRDTLWQGDNLLALRAQFVSGFASAAFPYRRFFGHPLAILPDQGVVVALADTPTLCGLTREGALRWATSLSVPVREVDERERAAIMPPLPAQMRNRGAVYSPEELYAEAWPRTIPVYVDVVASPGGWVAATRLERAGSRVLDIFTRRGKPAGSFALADDLVVLVATDDCLLVAIESDAGTEVRRYCPLLQD